MSQFRQTLKLLTAGKVAQAVWAKRFRLDRTNFNRLLRSEVPLGHRTVAKVLLGLHPAEQKQLLAAYLMDEMVAVSQAAAAITRRPQRLVGDPGTVQTQAADGVKLLQHPPDSLDGLPSDLAEPLARLIRAAKEDPAMAEKLRAALQLLGA